LSSVRHFSPVAHDIPLTFFHKILRVLSSVRHFFSLARDIPPNLFSQNIAGFHYCGVIFFSMTPAMTAV
jgi:hypothetical protein